MGGQWNDAHFVCNLNRKLQVKIFIQSETHDQKKKRRVTEFEKSH
jgi:hypothetical protein